MNQSDKVLLLKKAVDTWGQALQLIMVLEETSELQKEVCKIIRGDWSSERMDSLASEIADVSLMLEQLIFMTGTASKVKLEEDIKLERLNKRLNEGTLCQNHQ
jgi:NTP pyrophosphatase (non-canonical NTP hydrolase)